MNEGATRVTTEALSATVVPLNNGSYKSNTFGGEINNAIENGTALTSFGAPNHQYILTLIMSVSLVTRAAARVVGIPR